MTILLVVPAMAQPQESCECVFGPKAGQFQFQVNVGTSQFFNDFTGLYYLLPDEDGTATGIGADIARMSTQDVVSHSLLRYLVIALSKLRAKHHAQHRQVGLVAGPHRQFPKFELIGRSS